MPDAHYDLEHRLEEAGGRLPRSSESTRRYAREEALAALPSTSAGTRPKPYARRRVRLAGVAVTLVATAVIVFAVVSSVDGTAPFTTDKALAAIGNQPVVHAVMESEQPWATIVDLASGDERPQVQRTEFWYDGERGRLRARATVDGQLISELLQTRDDGTSPRGPLDPSREPRLDPALGRGFATRYRSALESGEARIVGETEVDGRDAVQLEIQSGSPIAGKRVREQVDVDADSFRPLRFRYLAGDDAASWWRVLEIEALPRDDERFAPVPASPVRPQAQTGSDEHEAADSRRGRERPRQARALARGRRRRCRADENRGAEADDALDRWPRDRGPGAPARIRWGEARSCAAVPWNPAGTVREERPRFGADEPALGPGQLQLFGWGALDGSSVDGWSTYFDQDGVFLTFESNERDMILEAARQLEPIR